jgi:hypothetical protein
VSPNRFQLEGSSLDDLNARILAQHGPHAKIVAVRTITTGGIQGFFAQRRYEADVDVPDGSAADAHDFDLPARTGIAQLLDGADSAERAHYLDSIPRLSTNSVDFDAIMADLTYNTAPIVPALAGPALFRHAPLSTPGDLVAVVGLGSDAVDIAADMAASGAQLLRTAGMALAAGVKAIGDRRAALDARATGVREEHSVVVALGIPRAGVDAEAASALALLDPDQVWVAVDAGRKPEDTERWVRAVQQLVHVDAVAVFGSDATASPKTVHSLGLQVGWVESGSVG